MLQLKNSPNPRYVRIIIKKIIHYTALLEAVFSYFLNPIAERGVLAQISKPQTFNALLSNVNLFSIVSGLYFSMIYLTITAASYYYKMVPGLPLK